MLCTYRTIAAAIALSIAIGWASAGAPGNLPVQADDRGRSYDYFDKLLPQARNSADEAAAKEVRDALNNGKSPWLTMAAIEAIRQAEVDQPGTGEVFLPDLLALLDEKQKKLHDKNEIVTVNLFVALGVLLDKESEQVPDVVRALVNWHKWSKNDVVRLRHLAERVLGKLTGEDCTLKDETLAFWDWWLRNKAMKQAVPEGEKQPEKKSKTAPIIYTEPMVGTRVVFVIDVSDSMKWPIAADDVPKLKAKAPHLPWDKESAPTALWLATQELAYSIEKLKPDTAAGGKGTRQQRNNPEMRHFAIVTYSKEVKLLTDGWVEATDQNCKKWANNARDLAPESLTNIHGGLMQAFGLSEKRAMTSSPELDRDCVLTGAHTIVFLTDGYATWSDDSTSQNQPDQWGRANQVGDGKFVKAEELVKLAIYLNRFRKVTINTVGIGNHDKELMKAFARNGGGSYVDWECKIDWK
ncbi:MAG: VWA domain-containing protein [Planctomycetes bacterium]|nr:VWA domain-containing protein [Planctomycetota bacterium]MCW8134957.1 VWA domain-containing protein [Planctomycetota bacterium]